MENLKYRVISEYEFNCGTRAAETVRKISDVYGGDVGKENTVRFWSPRFRSGNYTCRTSPVDGLRLAENEELKAIVEADPSQTTSELAVGCGVSDKAVLSHIKQIVKVLHKFATAVRNKDGDHNGALLLSVVGGKLSEGLNFSDELGRCVIVIGMPYPNVKSPELQEKMNYLNITEGSGAGNVYYENLCMKAVNQCIGRAVRHANDYACVLLVDERYSRPNTVAALPSFVQKSLLTNHNFGPTVGSIAKFFSKHKKTQ